MILIKTEEPANQKKNPQTPKLDKLQLFMTVLK